MSVFDAYPENLKKRYSGTSDASGYEHCQRVWGIKPQTLKVFGDKPE